MPPRACQALYHLQLGLMEAPCANTLWRYLEASYCFVVWTTGMQCQLEVSVGVGQKVYSS